MNKRSGTKVEIKYDGQMFFVWVGRHCVGAFYKNEPAVQLARSYRG